MLETRFAPGLIDRFIKIVGEKYAATLEDETQPYATERRGLYNGRTPLVLRPGSTQEVVEIMKLANETRTPIVPQGGNTGLVGAQTPDGEVVLSLNRMDRIRDLDPASNTITCDAGVVLQRVREAAAAADRLYPMSLPSEGSCTIGGNLSTNAGGVGALAYGVARDLVLGLEVVLADGRVLNVLNKLKKDNTGYDLRHIFMGAEGTLGVITAAVLKLFPLPKSTETAFIGFASVEAALEFYNLARGRTGANTTMYELMARITIDLAVKHIPAVRDPLTGRHNWYVLFQLTSPQPDSMRAPMEELLELGIEKGLIEDAVLAETIEHRNAFLRMREEMPEAPKFEGGSIKHDISVPVAAIPQFLAEADAAVERAVPGARPAAFGHMGDGNIHYNVTQPAGADTKEYLSHWDAMNAGVFAVVKKLGGSISAEHGIGRLKRDLLVTVKDPVAIEVMRAMKKTLDPNGILNPGKVL